MNAFEITLREVLADGHDARFRASGDSMYPTIRSGDYLQIARCEASDLRRGDVVLASMSRGLTAHRIVRIGERDGKFRIVTRGDNALRSDVPIEGGDVVGRVVWVESDRSHRAVARPAALFRIATVLVRRLRSRFTTNRDLTTSSSS